MEAFSELQLQASPAPTSAIIGSLGWQEKKGSEAARYVTPLPVREDSGLVRCDAVVAYFFFNVTATTEIYTLSLHDALPYGAGDRGRAAGHVSPARHRRLQCAALYA